MRQGAAVMVQTARGVTVKLVKKDSYEEATAYDAALVNRYRAGDESAFDEIIERYKHKLFALAMSMLRSTSDAEEVVQDAFIRAHRGLDRFRGDSAFYTWLHRIALNLSRNRYWYMRRRRPHGTISIDDLTASGNATFADMIASEQPGPYHVFVTEEFEGIVSKCLPRLTSMHREIFYLWTVYHLQYSEIAKLYGISCGTVKSRLARAREQLHAHISKEYPDIQYRHDLVRALSQQGIISRAA